MHQVQFESGLIIKLLKEQAKIGNQFPDIALKEFFEKLEVSYL